MTPLRGSCRVPGDKSISHRAAILGALAGGTTRVHGLSPAGDCRATIRALRTLGVRIERGARRGTDAEVVDVHGPLDPTPRDAGRVDCGRAGTAMRLLAGVIASYPIAARLTGDPQLLNRPMGRVAEPLREMGARVGLADGGRPPIHVHGGDLHGIDYRVPVASAQVKSAVLLAGLRAEGPTTVTEPHPSRDHTERMLEAMGARIAREDGSIRVWASALQPSEFTVPGDASSAAFLWTAAAIVPGSGVTVEDVGLNPGRIRFLEVLRRMGGDVEIEITGESSGEPVGRARVRHADLQGTTIEPDEVPALIDELPLLGLLATQAEGVTRVRGAAELRVKESDRIAGLTEGLGILGGKAEQDADGFAVQGPTRLLGGEVDGRGDHRLAMTFAVAGLAADGDVHVRGLAFAADSFPGFDRAVRALLSGEPA